MACHYYQSLQWHCSTLQECFRLSHLHKHSTTMVNTLSDHNKIVEVSKNFADYMIPLDDPKLHPTIEMQRHIAKAFCSTSESF
jgi:hypothetical protein